jgi:hypothetical protein
MTLGQVKVAQPNATTPSEPSALADGAACSLAIPSVEVLGQDYQACFFFKNGGLVQVTLSALGDPSEPQFRDLVTGLRAKYGKELSLDFTAMGYDADWMTADGVNVSVVFFNKYGNLLNVNYQVRLKASSDRL